MREVSRLADFLKKMVMVIDEEFSNMLNNLSRKQFSKISKENLIKKSSRMKSDICDYIDLKTETYLKYFTESTLTLPQPLQESKSNPKKD